MGKKGKEKKQKRVWGKKKKKRKGIEGRGRKKITPRKERPKGFPATTTPAAGENRAMQEIDFVTEVKNQVKNCLGQIKYFVQPENKGFVSLSGSFFLGSLFV